MDKKFHEITAEQLSPEAVEGVIKDFILREGTDYGVQSYTLDEKIAQIRTQLDNGKAKIVFDSETETCTILSSTTLCSMKAAES